MRSLDAKHLVIGGGLLGLATADHLLRRGADGVVVIEKASTPGLARRGVGGLVLSSGLPGNHSLEDRSHLLLDDWPTYLEIDPKFRRAGALVSPAPTQSPADWEALQGDDPRLRSFRSDESHAFAGRDGLLDTEELTGALHWQVRRRGGRVLTDCTVQSLTDHGGRIGFSGTTRQGSGERVYLTAGAETPALARTIGVPLPFRQVCWQEMQLVGEPGEFAIIRLRRRPPADDLGGLLELDADVCESESSDDSEVIVLHEDGSIYLSVVRSCGPRADNLAVDWSLWEEIREELTAMIPALASARVRSGRAEQILALDSSPVSPVVECNGRLIVGGSFGLSGLLLSLSVGEALAEAGLSKA